MICMNEDFKESIRPITNVIEKDKLPSLTIGGEEISHYDYLDKSLERHKENPDLIQRISYARNTLIPYLESSLVTDTFGKDHVSRRLWETSLRDDQDSIAKNQLHDFLDNNPLGLNQIIRVAQLGPLLIEAPYLF